MSFRPHLPLAVAVALFPVCFFAQGCGSKYETSMGWSYVDTEGGGVTATVDGVTLEVEPGVQYVSRYRSENGRVLENERTIDGHEVVMGGGDFRVGPMSYGPVESGDVIRVTPDGVLVNDENRGPLPAKIVPPEAAPE